MMIAQRYTFSLVIVLLVLVIFGISGCTSTRLAKTDSEASVREAIGSYIDAMNEEDINRLSLLYANDFLSYEPNYNVPKKELLASVQNGFDQQNYTVKAKIMEIISGPMVATAQLKWVIIGEKQEIVFANHLLQVWKKEQERWKLSRTLFFTGNDVPDLEDFDFEKPHNNQ